MAVWIKIFVLWIMWATFAGCSYAVQVIEPKNRLFPIWVNGVAILTATLFLLI